MESHWWRTIDYLELAGNAGIVLNSDKLQFCQQEVEFAGFKITASSVEPLPKYLDAIRDFPKPKSITDIRAWFRPSEPGGQLRKAPAAHDQSASPAVAEDKIRVVQ